MDNQIKIMARPMSKQEQLRLGLALPRIIKADIDGDREIDNDRI